MSNIIDNLLLSESTSTTTSANTVGEQSSKDKPSLFDSLLSNISTSEEVKVDSTTTTSVKTQGNIVDTKDVKVETNNLLGNDESLENIETTDNLDNIKISSEVLENKEQKITTGSLLDKLVIEAKKSANIEQSSKDKPSLFDSLLSNISINDETEQINQSAAVKITTDETLTINPKLASEIQTKNIESENLQNNDLLENIITESSNLNSELVEVVENKVPTKSVDESTKNLNIETKDILSESAKLEVVNTNLDTLSIAQEIVNNSDKINNEEIKLDENLIIKENLSSSNSSLLDKLVVDAKKNIKEASTKITLDTEKTIILDNTILAKNNSISEDETPIKVNDVVSEDIEKVVNLEILNNVQNQEPISNTTNLNTIIKDNIAATVPVIEENKSENLNTDLNNKIIDIKSPIIIKSDNTIVEKSENNVNDLINSIDSVSDNNVSNEANEANIITTSTNANDEIIVSKDNIEVEITKNPEIVQIKKDEKLSLMDQLIQKNTEQLTTVDSLNDNVMDLSTKEIITKDLISSIYLGSQKNQINNQSLFNKNEAISIIKEGSSIQSVKTSAEILDLGLEDISVEDVVEVDKIVDLKQLNKKDYLENILLQRNVKSEEVRNLITKSVEASKALLEDVLTTPPDTTVNVNSPLSYNIQSKIIGAKQQMATMMSDISRQMYENYKPPVTAFKINLNPTELGSIAILMKSDKNSGLSITMNVSNNVTLDTLIENQNVLKNSLNKTFDENTKFNLDFGSSNQNNNQSSNSQNQNSNRQFEQQMGTQAVLQLKEENKDIEEKVIDYM